MIGNELQSTVQIANGAGLKAPKDLIPYLTNLTTNSVLFIDEIHRIPRTVEEYLYTAMEDFRIDIVLGEGVNARTLNLDLQRFTMIGATTRAGMLSAPLRDRFQIREHLDFYNLDDLCEIVRRNAKKVGVPVDDEAAMEIGRRSRSTPRIANNRLLWVRDYVQSRSDGKGTYPSVVAAMEMIGIDHLGLDKQDRNYLDTLIRVFAGGPAGIEAIGHTMNVSIDTIEDEVEPFLLRSELIVRTRRGRMATPKAYQHLGREYTGGSEGLFDGDRTDCFLRSLSENRLHRKGLRRRLLALGLHHGARQTGAAHSRETLVVFQMVRLANGSAHLAGKDRTLHRRIRCRCDRVRTTLGSI